MSRPTKSGPETSIAPWAAVIAVTAGLGCFLVEANFTLIVIAALAALTWLVCVIVAATR
jgi:hypothetical protein